VEQQNLGTKTMSGGNELLSADGGGSFIFQFFLVSSRFCGVTSNKKAKNLRPR
jgi:hypothetical protein